MDTTAGSEISTDSKTETGKKTPAARKITTYAKKCSDCSVVVPKEEKKCRNCGSDFELTKWLRISGICLVLSIIVMIIGGVYYNYENPSVLLNDQNLFPAEKITAADLYNAYAQNEIEADKKYRGKILEVSGNASSIDEDTDNNMSIALDTGNISGSVQCMLEDSEKYKAAGLREGQFIVVQGKNTLQSSNIILKNCVIKK